MMTGILFISIYYGSFQLDILQQDWQLQNTT